LRLPHRWSLAHNYLAGITAGDWLRLLRENNFSIDGAYFHRAAFITLTSLANSWWRHREEKFLGHQLDAISVPPPLFIVGHWRSGTTHLHNLLSLDTEQFAFPTTYQVVNPHTFLLTEKTNARRFAWMVPPRRPMDNMALSFAAPQEDEFAPCLMSLRSPYLGISFPRSEDYYERFLTFHDAPDDAAAWSRAFVKFVRKLTLLTGRPLLLKSPPHTARIRLLLELFPDARFVHIHRHPFAVFQSFRRYYDTAVWHTYLQRPNRSSVDTRILTRYRNLHDAWFSERQLIPPGRCHELRFDDLERDPVGEVAKIYGALGLDGFETVLPRLQSYAATQSDYRRNEFPPLSPEESAMVASICERSLDLWKYPRNP
jgi:hypothetical protein